MPSCASMSHVACRGRVQLKQAIRLDKRTYNAPKNMTLYYKESYSSVMHTKTRGGPVVCVTLPHHVRLPAPADSSCCLTLPEPDFIHSSSHTASGGDQQANSNGGCEKLEVRRHGGSIAVVDCAVSTALGCSSVKEMARPKVHHAAC